MTMHYICDICLKYIRPNKGQKIRRHNMVWGHNREGKPIITGYTKAHKRCLGGK